MIVIPTAAPIGQLFAIPNSWSTSEPSMVPLSPPTIAGVT